ncbi:hypothetical protein Tco_0973400 [Tanacetum coccineum]
MLEPASNKLCKISDSLLPCLSALRRSVMRTSHPQKSPGTVFILVKPGSLQKTGGYIKKEDRGDAASFQLERIHYHMLMLNTTKTYNNIKIQES